MRPRGVSVQLALLSMAVMLLEVSYTRIFSFKLMYYFTYFIIGTALLGLGAGGVLVATVGRLRRATRQETVGACAPAAAVAVLVGYLVVAATQLRTVRLMKGLAEHALGPVFGEAARLVLLCAALFVPFLLAGIAVAKILASAPERVNRLYFADLVGAGLACALAVPLLTHLSPPGTVFLAGALLALAGARPAANAGWLRTAPFALAPVLLLGAALPGRLPDPVPDEAKTLGRPLGPNTILFSRWHPVFRVDVSLPLGPGWPYVLHHDGMWGSHLHPFDGDAAKLERYDRDPTALPFRLLGPGRHVAIIGAAGGNEILASLHFDAAAITAVELNPVTVSLLTSRYAALTGHLAEQPRVRLVTAEGRSFLRGDSRRYDLVWFVAPDTYAAMNAATAGAYVLSESYLYTEEMIAESLDHLTDDGFVCAQFGEVDFAAKPNRTLRYVATAREAFRRRGVTDFERHVLAATSTPVPIVLSTVLLKKSPLAEGDVARFADGVAAVPNSVARYVPGRADGDPRLQAVVSLPPDALARWQALYPFDVRPVGDDAPFFWHFVGFREAVRRGIQTGDLAWEDGVGEQVLLALLLLATVLAAGFLLVPLVARPAIRRLIPANARISLYFGAIGAGFMLLEVTLIQRLTLLLGYPSYSLTVTLFALLASTGVGSALAARYPTDRRVLLLLVGAVAALVLSYQVGLPALARRFGGGPFALRAALAVATLAPLGLCLGGFLPLGVRVIAGLGTEAQPMVAWAWGVNGFASVVSSVLATVLAMAAGFTAVMSLAVALYVVGAAALLGLLAGGSVTEH